MIFSHFDLFKHCNVYINRYICAVWNLEIIGNKKKCSLDLGRFVRAVYMHFVHMMLYFGITCVSVGRKCATLTTVFWIQGKDEF